MAVASSSRARARPWALSLLVVGVAALVRLPHYDVTLFSGDQIDFMWQARRVLAGHWDVMGPMASGLNVVGPLYSYLLAGLLWLRDDPAFLGLFGVMWEVLATWFVYDTARRVSGPAAGIVGAATYVLAPPLVLGTRLLWNPSLLPGLVTFGWWQVVRYCDAPSTAKLLGVALTAGLTPALHATGVFHGAALSLAVLAAKRPSLPQLIAACATGMVPLSPVLPRLLGSTSDLGVLGGRIAPAEFAPTVEGLARILLSFPVAAFGQHWSAVASAAALHVQAVVAAMGIARGLAYRSRYLALWLGIAFSSAANIGSAFFYTGPLSWHHFIAITPGACFAVAHAVGYLHRFRVTAAVSMVLVATTHLFFFERFDRRLIDSGLFSLPVEKLALRVPPMPVVLHSPTLRDMRVVGSALQGIVPDGATALLVAHGARGELWRETGAEFLPGAPAPRDRWSSQFVIMGPAATLLRSNARLIDGRVCVFDGSSAPAWRAQHQLAPAGWELPQFADDDWTSLDLPRRITRASLVEHRHDLAAWHSPRLALRGRFTVASLEHRHAFGVVIRSRGNSQHWIASTFVNGVHVAPVRDRVLHSAFSRTQEWFIDVSDQIRLGQNVIALAIDGHTPLFDLDIFEVPCSDAEWYF